MKTKAVLFDVDGVLVNACQLHFDAFNKALEEVGLEPLTMEEHLKEYNGRPTKEKLAILGTKRCVTQEQKAQVSQRKQEITLLLISMLGPNYPALQLLRQLRQLGIKIAAASNSLRKSIFEMLRASGLHEVVEAVVGNDDVAYPKPMPDVYIKAAELLGVPIQDCVIVEDSPVGLAAANRAGAKAVIQVAGPHEVTPALLERLL